MKAKAYTENVNIWKISWQSSSFASGKSQSLIVLIDMRLLVYNKMIHKIFVTIKEDIDREGILHRPVTNR